MPASELVLFECAHCDRLVTTVPVRDEFTDRMWCSQDCADEAAEAYWLGRWSW